MIVIGAVIAVVAIGIFAIGHAHGAASVKALIADIKAKL